MTHYLILVHGDKGDIRIEVLVILRPVAYISCFYLTSEIKDESVGNLTISGKYLIHVHDDKEDMR